MHSDDEQQQNHGSFTMDELKQSATSRASAIDPETAMHDVVRLPLRGRGWFVPYAQVAMEEQEEREKTNAERGLLDAPPVAYCYMCDSWEVKQGNPYRATIAGMIGLIDIMDMAYVVGKIAQFYQKKIQRFTRKHWSIHAIREHITKHVIHPTVILTENIRGLQTHIDVHVENMEQVEEDDEGGDGEEGEDTASRGSRSARKRRRRIDPKEEESYMKLVRLQTAQILTLGKLRSGNGGGGGNVAVDAHASSRK